MSNSKMFAKFASGLALAGAASFANAAIVYDTQTQSFNLANTEAVTANSADNSNAVVEGTALTQNLTFAGFDDSLGTLTNVYITFDSGWSLDGSINAASTLSSTEGGSTAASSATGQIGGTYNIALIDPTSNDVQVEESQSAFCFEIIGGCSNDASKNGDFDSALNVSSIDLAEFLGGTVTVGLSQTLTAQITGCHAGVPNTDGSWSSTTECNVANDESAWSGDVNVVYVYDDGTATNVPEPATLALFGLGLAGLGFARRKQS